MLQQLPEEQGEQGNSSTEFSNEPDAADFPGAARAFPSAGTPSIRPMGADMNYWAEVVESAGILRLDENQSCPAMSPELEVGSEVDFEDMCLTSTGVGGSVSTNDVRELKTGTASEACSQNGAYAKEPPHGIRHSRSTNAFHPMRHVRVPNKWQNPYYGATSSLSRAARYRDSRIQPSFNSRATLQDVGILSMGLSWQQDKSYEARVVQLFFQWYPPAFCGINKEQFLEAKQLYESGRKPDFYSPALYDAILSAGSTLESGLASHAQIPKPYRPAEFFALRARALIDNELETSNMATLQAILVMSQHEAAEGRESRG
jgi:hypothetical protein